MPIKPAFDVQQLNRLVRALNKAGQSDLVEAIKEANAEAAKTVENEARPNVPRRTGKLVASLRSSGTKRAGTVRIGKARLPYAGPIHFGWPNRPNSQRGWMGGPIAPQPFLYEAIDAKFNDVINVYWERIEKICEAIADV